MLPVVNMRPPQPQVITKVSISALVISLPILYVSLLRLPPSTLARDTTFWFLMSNSIIVIIAADSGMLFVRSNSTASGDDEDPSYLPADQPAVTVQEDSRVGPPVPLMTSDEPTVKNEQLRQEEVASKMNKYDHALALIKDEEDEHAETKSNTDVNHAWVLRAKEAAAAYETSANKNNAMIVEGEEEEEAREPNKLLVEEEILVSPSSASENGDDVTDELVIVNYDYAFAEAEPWSPRLVASKILVLEEEEDQWPNPHPRVTPDDVLEDKSIVVSREVKLRRPAEEREYWQLSDEELNRRVEEFITRFNREMRLQIEQEAGVLSSSY